MSKNNKRMPVWAMVVTDTLLTCAAVGVFMLFDYVKPQTASGTGTIVAQVDSGEENNFALPDRQAGDDVPENTESSYPYAEKIISETAGPSEEIIDSQPAVTTSPHVHEKPKRTTANWYDNTGTDEYSADENAVSSIVNADIYSEEIGHYENESSDITLYKKSFGEGSDKITYYTADIYVTNVSVLKTALAENTYGKNIKDTIDKMAEDNNAIFAVNGDFYGNSEEGIVVRNGVKYRDNLNDCDICVLFTDGTMETYSYVDFDTNAVIERGVWQAWCFGPMLLDGHGGVLSSFNTTTYLNSANPRTAIGYIAPGHYIIAVVDGRDEGYSKGATISELAAIMADEGCLTAYNLDGGKSSMMWYDGSMANQPDDGRRVSDIIYFER